MFIPPMRCTSRRDPSRLGDPRDVTEPKLDGQRAQIHVGGGRTVAAFSRPERGFLELPFEGAALWQRVARGLRRKLPTPPSLKSHGWKDPSHDAISLVGLAGALPSGS
jgi:hypothetical protein